MRERNREVKRCWAKNRIGKNRKRDCAKAGLRNRLSVNVCFVRKICFIKNDIAGKIETVCFIIKTLISFVRGAISKKYT